jgi:AraC-like DNA-binding protein
MSAVTDRWCVEEAGVRVAQFRTADLPPGDRFPAWYELTSKAHVSTAISTDNGDDFAATLSLLDLGTVQVSTLTYPPLRAIRTAKLIRRSDPGLYLVSLTLGGKVRFDHAGHETFVDTGELILIDASLPGDVVNDVPLEQMVIQIPKASFPLRPRVVERALARPMPARRGVGSLVTSFMKQLMVSADEYAASDGARLTALVVDLVACLITSQLDEPAMAGDSRQRLLERRVLNFIEQRLGDPTLTPAVIAAAHQISVRYLHLLFHDQGLTVAGWIRRRRLDHCCRDLVDPSLDSRPVHAIGARWGFTDAASFSRVFRRAYGLPPGDYRSQHRSSPLR